MTTHPTSLNEQQSANIVTKVNEYLAEQQVTAAITGVDRYIDDVTLEDLVAVTITVIDTTSPEGQTQPKEDVIFLNSELEIIAPESVA